MGTQCCEFSSCTNEGLYKAPKHRGLNEHYSFCLEHVQEYNKSWNFFEGMSDQEVMDHVNKARYGDRPTWRYATYAEAEEFIRQRSWDDFRSHDENDTGDKRRRSEESHRNLSHESTEFKAMSIMGLNPPITFQDIKTTYRQLVKKHHPDLNEGCKKAEDRLKEINMAYTVLKGAYEKYDQLMGKKS